MPEAPRHTPEAHAAKPLKATLNLPQTTFPMKAGLPANEPLRLAAWQQSGLYEQIRQARAGAPRYILHDGPPYANGAIHLGHALNKTLKDFVVKTRTMAGYDAPYVPGWDCHGLPIEIKVDEQLGRKKLEMDPVQVRRACRDYAQKYLDLQRSQFIRMGIFGRWSEPYSTMDPAYEARIAETFFHFFENGFVYKGLKPVSWCIHDRTALAEAEVEYANHTSPSIYVRYRLTSDPTPIHPDLATDPGAPAGAPAGTHAGAPSKLSLGGRDPGTPAGASAGAPAGTPAGAPSKLRLGGNEPLNPSDSQNTPKPIYAIIWTTTPWTLPASLAIAFHPEMEYVAIDTPDAIYLVSQALLSSVITHCHLMSGKHPAEPASQSDIIAAFKGQHLDRATFAHPFLLDGDQPRTVLGTLATYVTADQGTGAVHTAPAHGVDDFSTGQRYQLQNVQYVDDAGRQMHTERFGAGTAQPYEGLTVFKSNAVIIELLREHNALLGAATLDHSYPHCWRCHNPVITRATEQWFIRMETPMDTPMAASAKSFGGAISATNEQLQTTFRQRALEEIERVTWDPAWGKDRITNMVATRPDWCISRQRIWGVPIAVFLCRKCGDPLKDPAVNRSVVALFTRDSADAWYLAENTPEALLPAGTTCPACGHHEFRKEMDILDVWFESGASSHAVLDFDRDTMQLPGDPDKRADLYAEGGDQHRGWFMSSLLCSIGMHNRAPFKTVATYGWTLDEKGRALSKSLGNFIDPVAVMDQLGGDIVRLWVASVDFREDVVASLPLLKRLAEEIYRKLRNTFRFLLGALSETNPSTGETHTFDPRPIAEGGDAIPFDQLQPIDQYILAKTADLTARITKAYADFEFHRVYHLLNEFCNSDLSAFYLDVLKDRLYTYPIAFKPGRPPQAPGLPTQEDLYLARRSAQTAIYKITDALARLTAPILSFTADEVWQSLPGTTGSVHLQLFPTPEDLAQGESGKLIADWDSLLVRRSEVLGKLESLRADKVIGKALEAVVSLYVSGDEEHASTTRHLASLPELFNVSEVDVLAVTHNDPDYLPNLVVERSGRSKCDRCWRHVPDVGNQEKYPTVCLRCAEALDAINHPAYTV
ncbi:MAG: isoleucine--tRNA ligase [Acidobacteriota bacterium]|nr:isoleucine--tRNA ligase [Acidobacteriota bacterium]